MDNEGGTVIIVELRGTRIVARLIIRSLLAVALMLLFFFVFFCIKIYKTKGGNF